MNKIPVPLKVAAGASGVLLARHSTLPNPPPNGGGEAGANEDKSKKTTSPHASLLQYLAPTALRELLTRDSHDDCQLLLSTAQSPPPLLFISGQDRSLIDSLMMDLTRSRPQSNHVHMKVSFMGGSHDDIQCVDVLKIKKGHAAAEPRSWVEMIQSRIRSFLYGEEDDKEEEKDQKQKRPLPPREFLQQVDQFLKLSTRPEPPTSHNLVEQAEDKQESNGAVVGLTSTDELTATIVIDLELLIILASGLTNQVTTHPKIVASSATVLEDLLSWGKRRSSSTCQIIFIAGGPLGIWKLHQLLMTKEAFSQTAMNEDEENDDNKTTTSPCGVLDAPLIHLFIVGPNKPLIGVFASEMAHLMLEPTSIVPTTPPATDDAENEVVVVAKEDEASLSTETGVLSLPKNLQRFIELNPDIGTLKELGLKATAGADPADVMEALVIKETERLLAKLGVSGDKNTNPEFSVLLWDALNAIHGERIDVLTGAPIGVSGVLPLENLISVCEENIDNVESLLAEGWLRLNYPSDPEEAEPQIVCSGLSTTLRGLKYPLREISSVGTPPLVTLAWQRVHLDKGVAPLMNARTDARHLKRELDYLAQQRTALATEWDHLSTAREALRQRKRELNDEEFVSLQLELVRLERAASSRAWEMQLRARRLKELQSHLCESSALPQVEIPSFDIQSASVEDKVLDEMALGVKGVPVEHLTKTDKSKPKEKSPSFLARWFRK